MPNSTPREKIHFVTGRLAESSLRDVLTSLAARERFEYSVEVLPITVAALMTCQWVAPRVHVPKDATRVILPGYCGGNLGLIAAVAPHAAVERGPKDLRALPEYLGHASIAPPLDAYDIEILAEINHAPRLDRTDVLALAKAYRTAGADVIDLGCDPGGPWSGVRDCVRALRDEGYRVSIDSLDPREIADAVSAGAELVLSVNSQNRHCAADWGCEVVVIPDQPRDPHSLDESIAFLESRGVSFRVDPILEPIGCGFAGSLARYIDVHRRYPDVPMLMGIGNLTELSDCDSAALNLCLLGFCQELRIHSVLTTQVIPWAATSVRECDVARRIVHYAVRQGVPPKRLDDRLVMLRDPALFPMGREAIERLASQIRDPNYRVFAEEDRLHIVSAGLHLEENDPYRLFERLLASGAHGQPPKNLNLSHAFYLGYELAKAVTALTLGKQYTQDEALRWGLLTRPERNRHTNS